jgi:hypothetical protein
MVLTQVLLEALLLSVAVVAVTKIINEMEVMVVQAVVLLILEQAELQHRDKEMLVALV